MHQIHAAGAVGRVVADQNGAGVDDAALGNAHHEKSQCQQDLCAGQAHDGIARRIADGEQQHTGLHPQHTGQHADKQTCQQVAHAHEREQGAGHAVGKAVFFLQKADHNARADGADAAEKEGGETRVAQARVLLLIHDGMFLTSYVAIYQAKAEGRLFYYSNSTF